MTPKEQKIEYWYKKNDGNLQIYCENKQKEGWFVHQIIPFRGDDIMDAAYIVFNKY